MRLVGIQKCFEAHVVIVVEHPAIIPFGQQAHGFFEGKLLFQEVKSIHAVDDRLARFDVILWTMRKKLRARNGHAKL